MTERKEEKPTPMNAFDLISMSKGLNLGNLFDVEQVGVPKGLCLTFPSLFTREAPKFYIMKDEQNNVHGPIEFELYSLNKIGQTQDGGGDNGAANYSFKFSFCQRS